MGILEQKNMIIGKKYFSGWTEQQDGRDREKNQ